MKLKMWIMGLLSRSVFLKKISIRLANRVDIGKNFFRADNIHFSRNQIRINGKNNCFDCNESSFLRGCCIYIDGNDNRIEIEGDTQIYGDSTVAINIIGNHNRVHIGKNVTSQSSSLFVGGNDNEILLGNNVSTVLTEYHIEQNKNQLIICDGCTFHGRNGYPIHIALDEETKVIIEEDCMFANGTQIRSTDSHSIMDLQGDRINPAEDIRIGRHCWMGLGCTILKGVQIPDNSVVAAGAVCTRKFEGGMSLLPETQREL